MTAEEVYVNDKLQTTEQLKVKLSKELKLGNGQVDRVLTLSDEGNTIPFIARYRKEMTGSLDEVQIKEILDRWNYLQNLEQRKLEVLRSVDEQGKLTSELEKEIVLADKLQKVEDLYRPYKQKRRTRAITAKENGLEPLAKYLLSFPTSGDVEAEAAKYVNEKVESVEKAIRGAGDIIAEIVADDAKYREWIRKESFRFGMLTTTATKKSDKDEKKVYEMYYEYEEQVSRIVPHRILAVNRGEKEEVLKVTIATNVEKVVEYLTRQVVKNPKSVSAPYVVAAIEDAYKRLIKSSVENEIRSELSEKAEDQAIHIFSENLRNLLLQPPMKGKMVLGVDPAYRTGCKLAVVDQTGKMLEIAVIYPHTTKDQTLAKKKFIEIVKKHKIEIITIGNGTASRETESFVAEILKELSQPISYIIVNEAGASVYSASEVARSEFPDLQVEERSAVSIARRLQDPLSELVKIDPKSVGVGQYQHDVAEKKLNESLTFVVETSVNQVGVNVNTASVSLLQYVSGLSKSVAQNIVKRRDEEGAFVNRTALKGIPRLGAKTYEQAIGFLRVLDGKEPLDRTPIHPEQYANVRSLLKKLNMTTDMLGTDELIQELKEVNVSETASELNIGEITLIDILDALAKPERDLREQFDAPLLKSDVLKIEDLKPGMELQGTVRNVVDFGAFIDIGVKQDGLVHISKLSTKRVKHPMDVVSVGQVVTVWIDNVEVGKNRIALTLISPQGK